jgi:hypothetical protein
MLSMEFIAEHGGRHFVSGESISSIARSLKLSRPTVRKALKIVDEPTYQRQNQPTPKLGEFQKQLLDWLELDAKRPKRQRRTAQRLFECPQVEGCQGSYGPVQRFVLTWKQQAGSRPSTTQAFVPLTFPAGETCQFDWGHEFVVLGGVAHSPKYSYPEKFCPYVGALIFLPIQQASLRVLQCLCH